MSEGVARVGVVMEKNLEKHFRVVAATLGKTKSRLLRDLAHAITTGKIVLPEEYMVQDETSIEPDDENEYTYFYRQ